MGSSLDLRRVVPIVLVAVLAVVGLVMASRGGAGSGGNSAQKLVEQAFSGANAPKSGRFDVHMTVSLQGAPEALAKPFELRGQGVFERASGQTPKVDFDMTAQGGGERVALGVVLTGDRAFVEYQGRAYEVPRAQVERLRGGSARDDSAVALASLGVDPRRWIRNVADAGTAQVGGEPVTHVTAEADGARVLSDLERLAQRSDQYRPMPQQVRSAVEHALKDTKVDVYASQRDKGLRRLAVSGRIEVDNPQGGAPITGSFALDAQITDVGTSQRITAPKRAVPFAQLDASGLAPFVSGGLPTAPEATPSRPAREAPRHARSRGGRGGRSGSATRPAPSAASRSEAYVGCVERAADVQALMRLVNRRIEEWIRARPDHWFWLHRRWPD
jgi:hypothetical protein